MALCYLLCTLPIGRCCHTQMPFICKIVHYIRVVMLAIFYDFVLDTITQLLLSCATYW